jgi:hypothetical protein
MNIDERLAALAEQVKETSAQVDRLTETVLEHERWHNRVERAVIVGVEAALNEWRKGQ